LIGGIAKRGSQIKKIASVLAIACLSQTAYAEDKEVVTQSAIQLKEKGFVACAHAVDDIASFLFHSDFAYLNLWNQSDIKKHSALVTGAKSYAVGKSILTITATESQVGTCDASFTLVMPFPEDCTKIRQTTFKDWRVLFRQACRNISLRRSEQFPR